MSDLKQINRESIKAEQILNPQVLISEPIESNCSEPKLSKELHKCDSLLASKSFWRLVSEHHKNRKQEVSQCRKKHSQALSHCNSLYITHALPLSKKISKEVNDYPEHLKNMRNLNLISLEVLFLKGRMEKINWSILPKLKEAGVL